MAALLGNDYGKRFSATNQPHIKGGRKPSRITTLIKIFGMEDQSQAISKDDAYKLMAHLLSCSKTQLEAMARNPDLPISIVCQIKAIITDLSYGRTDTVDRLFDRLYGKSMVSMEITGAQGIPLIPDKPMSRIAYQKLLSKLQGEG